MHADNLSRALLAAILVCLVLLIVEGRGAEESAAEPAPAPAIERFEIRAIVQRRGPPVLLRTDTATGQAWTMGLMAEPVWIPLAEDGDGVPEPGGDVPGRFFIRAHKQTRGAPTLVRHDSVNGRAWRKGSMNKRPWVAVPNPESAAPATPDPAGIDTPEPDLEGDEDQEPEAPPEAEEDA